MTRIARAGMSGGRRGGRSENRAPQQPLPRGIRRRPHDQVVEQDLGAVLDRQAREPIGAGPLADLAAHPDQNPRIIGQPPDAGHGREVLAPFSPWSGLTFLRIVIPLYLIHGA